MAKHREYYKGEGAGLPQVRAVVSFVNPCLPVGRLCTKSVPTPFPSIVFSFGHVVESIKEFGGVSNFLPS